MRQTSYGFSLFDLLVAVAITAVLLGIALPAWSAARARVHSVNARAAIAMSLHDSMRHATVTGSEVVLCPSSIGSSCTPGTNWSLGWIAFIDSDGNRLPGSSEPVIRVETALQGNVELFSTAGRKHLVFQPNGSNAGSNVTFTLCDGRGPRHAATLVLANGGQIRTDIPSTHAAARCTRRV
ncbi:GspH/FimT family pseudopilin [Cognatilysobacter bugurensis]|uniref:Type II secretion system protein H n=1 Tax=Cognatilysobacter bugurensis TaxID=543356 RepID=A0A918W839_9GAMM|nr:GspH/FimT family pseudopilin [Lysobacter bugurensis]GHA76244.1 hypothetical protein GCM10007067_11830 [Lysobacter bugurensis]